MNPLCIYFFPQAKNPQPYPPLFHRVTGVDKFIQGVDSFCGKVSLPFAALHFIIEDNFVQNSLHPSRYPQGFIFCGYLFVPFANKVLHRLQFCEKKIEIRARLWKTCRENVKV